MQFELNVDAEGKVSNKLNESPYNTDFAQHKAHGLSGGALLEAR